MGSICAFRVSAPRNIEQAETKTRKHRTIRKRTQPAFIEPMQCKPVTALPADEKWSFEIKFDGYRCIVVKRGSAVTLFSRNEKVLNKRFPKIVDALAARERLRSRRRAGRLRCAREAFLSASAKPSPNGLPISNKEPTATAIHRHNHRRNPPHQSALASGAHRGRTGSLRHRHHR